MARPTVRRATAALLTGLLLLSVGSTGALAHGPAADADDAIELGSHDIRIVDATIQIEDVHVTGSGLPEKSIDEASFTVDGESTIDGVTFTVNGQEYDVGHTHIVLDDVGVTVENVSIGSE